MDYEAPIIVEENGKEEKGQRSLAAGARLGPTEPVPVLELFPLARVAEPFLVGAGRLAPGFSGFTTSLRPNSSRSESEPSGVSTAIDSGLEVPSLSLAFAFSSASLARSLTHVLLSSRILCVRFSLEVPTSSFFQSTSRSAFGVLRFV